MMVMKLDLYWKKPILHLNKVKSSGKNKYQYFTNLIDVESFKHFSLRNDLKKAIEEEEFFIQYQPKVELSTNQVIGAEALVRWEHPKWGTVPPFEFIVDRRRYWLDYQARGMDSQSGLYANARVESKRTKENSNCC